MYTRGDSANSAFAHCSSCVIAQFTLERTLLILLLHTAVDSANSVIAQAAGDSANSAIAQAAADSANSAFVH